MIFYQLLVCTYFSYKNRFDDNSGEIVLWDDKDQGGYTNSNHGEWAKIDGRQWFGNNLLKSCSKTSFSKRFIFELKNSI